MAKRETVSGESKSTGKANGPDSLPRTIAKLQRQLEDQNERIAALARGREDSMHKVEELRAELALVASERDKLRHDLTAVENMQTETVALGEGEFEALADTAQGNAPSIDELMSSFSGVSEGLASHSTVRVEDDGAKDSEEYQEMISPEMIVLGSRREHLGAATQRFLVLADGDSHTQCPLDQELMTIGRSDSADIKIDGDFVSRIHARVLRIGMDSVIEDAGSKNGTRVNGDLVQRHVLKHGDLVRIGSASFRYMDTATGSDVPD
jgi:hypothetical protein